MVDFWQDPTFLGILSGVVVGVVVGGFTALVSSFIIDPRSVRKDRKLRHIDHLLSDVYGPIHYALKQAVSRAIALSKQGTTADYVLYESDVKTIVDTLHKDWGLVSKAVQDKWLEVTNSNVYLIIEEILEGKKKFLAATNKELKPFDEAVEKEVEELRGEYAKESGVRLP